MTPPLAVRWGTMMKRSLLAGTDGGGGEGAKWSWRRSRSIRSLGGVAVGERGGGFPFSFFFWQCLVAAVVVVAVW